MNFRTRKFFVAMIALVFLFASACVALATGMQGMKNMQNMNGMQNMQNMKGMQGANMGAHSGRCAQMGSGHNSNMATHGHTGSQGGRHGSMGSHSGEGPTGEGRN